MTKCGIRYIAGENSRSQNCCGQFAVTHDRESGNGNASRHGDDENHVSGTSAEEVHGWSSFNSSQGENRGSFRNLQPIPRRNPVHGGKRRTNTVLRLAAGPSNQTVKTEWYMKPIASGRFHNYYSAHSMKQKVSVAPASLKESRRFLSASMSSRHTRSSSHNWTRGAVDQ